MRRMKKKKFDYFEALVNMSLYAWEEAELLTAAGEEAEEGAGRICGLRSRCCGERRRATAALAREFLPPFDKEDLLRLFRLADILAGAIESAGALLSGTDARAQPSALFRLLAEECKALVGAMKELGDLKKSEELCGALGALSERCERGRRLCAEGAADLFGETGGSRALAEGLELYRRLGDCFAAAGALADEAELAILKNA